jgi:hypothetical protein
MTIAFVRRRVVEAIRWTPGARPDFDVQGLVHMVKYNADGTLEVPSVGRLSMTGAVQQNSRTVRPGDWVVKIDEGIFLVCEPEVFDRMFEVQR